MMVFTIMQQDVNTMTTQNALRRESNIMNRSNHTGTDVMDTSHIMHSPEYMALSVAIVVLSVVGTSGNVPVLIVYWRRNDKKISNTFIKILAFIDLLVCAFIMPYTLVYELHLVHSDIACRLFEFIRHFAVSSSNITLVAIAAERYFAVCHFAKKFTVQNVNCGMCVVMTISAILAMPAVLIFALVEPSDVKDVVCRFPHTGNNTHFCHFTTSIVGPLPAYIYQSLLMMSFFLSLLLIVVFYCIIYSKLWSRTKLKTLQTRPQRKYVFDNKSETSGISFDRRVDSGKCICYDQQSDNNVAVTNGECSEISCCPEASFRPVFLPASVLTTQRGTVKPKRLTLHYRTAKMLFMCTVIYLVTWLPFWFDIFGVTHSLLLRYMFFIGNATNPIVYGIFNVHVRQSFLKLFYEFKSNISLIFKGSTVKARNSTSK